MVALQPADRITPGTAFAKAVPVGRVDNKRIAFTFLVEGTFEGAVRVRAIFRFAQVAFDQRSAIQVAFKSYAIDHDSPQ